MLKKFESILMFSIPSTSLQTDAISRSKSDLGAAYTSVGSLRTELGAGSACRSSLPVGVSGSAWSQIKVEGIMYSGSLFASEWRRVLARCYGLGSSRHTLA